MKPIDVIGIGQGKQDLTQTHLDIITQADVLVGGRRHLEMFPGHNGETIVIQKDINRIVNDIRDHMVTQKVVVLASGDPLFHGIGSTLVKIIDKDFIRIHANISSVSAAFAAIREPWHDATLVSLHGKPGSGFSFSSLALESKVAFLTGPRTGPAYIADQLKREGIYGFRFCVLENLGDDAKETITWFDGYDQVMNQQFSHPNIVILLGQSRDTRNVSHETHLGMDDDLFRHSKGLITKSEVRSISISKLKLIRKDHVIWDIGSGSGSVGIEASFQNPWGQVFCIEKNPGRIPDIIQNIQNFNRSNVMVVNQDFPNGVDDLKPPDRIFIGGGGKNLEQILETACTRLKAGGIMVINTVLLETVHIAFSMLEKKQFSPQMVQVQVSRSTAMPFGNRLESLNPVWIISGSKPISKGSST